MFTRFEEYAAATQLGQPDSPPRSQGRLQFTNAWERQLYGLTLAVSKQGHIEWEDFRAHLIRSIGDWERMDCGAQPRWDYYERFLDALVQVLRQSDVITAEEIETLLASGAAVPPISSIRVPGEPCA